MLRTYDSGTPVTLRSTDLSLDLSLNTAVTGRGFAPRGCPIQPRLKFQSFVDLGESTPGLAVLIPRNRSPKLGWPILFFQTVSRREYPMQARVVRLYPDRPQPRHIDFESAPSGELGVIHVAGVRVATLTVNPSMPRNVLPELRHVEIDGLRGDRIRLAGVERIGDAERPVVWLCEVTTRA